MSTTRTAFGETEDVFERVIDPPVPLSTTWFRLETLAPAHNDATTRRGCRVSSTSMQRWGLRNRTGR